MNDKYVTKTIPMFAVHLEDGMYSIAQLEEILAAAKEHKTLQDKALQWACQPIIKETER